MNEDDGVDLKILRTVRKVFDGSDGGMTKDLYAWLEQRATPPSGVIAVNLFRACKASIRAKAYRGGVPGQGSYRAMAYQKKDWSMGNLAKTLNENADLLRWGWGIDKVLLESGDPNHNVLFVELPTGQVSFHNARRLEGPAHDRPWDGKKGVTDTRITRWCAMLLTEARAKSRIEAQAKSKVPA